MKVCVEPKMVSLVETEQKLMQQTMHEKFDGFSPFAKKTVTPVKLDISKALKKALAEG